MTIPDWIVSGVAATMLTFFLTFFYFWSFYLGRHPERAMLALRELREIDFYRLRMARSLLNGIDYIFEYPQQYARCTASDNGDHLGCGPNEDGNFGCYWCGVVAKAIPVGASLSERTTRK